MSAVLEKYDSLLTQTQESYLTVKNRVDEFSKLSNWINDIAILFKISEKAVFKIDLTLNEIMANIISYAYPNQCDSEIKFKFQYMDSKIKIDIEDNGIPFNPLARQDVVLPKTLADAPIGGLGIFIIRHYVDDSSYQRKNNKNIFTIQINI